MASSSGDPIQSQTYDPTNPYPHPPASAYLYPSYPVPAGLNPAAAAAVEALSQLSNFASSMGAAERVRMDWHGGEQAVPRFGGDPSGAVLVFPEGRMYKGDGGRGRGKGKSGHFRQNTGPSTSRGRGRGERTGRGKGKLNDRPASGSRPQNSASTTEKEPTASATAPTQTRATLLPVAWCDLCRVDCNSSEILEQHKNGKRHKKTAKRYEEMQARQKMLEMEAKSGVETLEQAIDPTESMSEPQSSGATKQAEKATNSVNTNQAEQGAKNSAQQSYFKNENALANSNSESDKTIPSTVESSDAGNVEPALGKKIISEPKVEKSHQQSRPLHPSKRKAAGKSNGVCKKARNQQGKPDRPKDRSCVCSICNIFCDTPAVFERHLAGKKHAAKAKRVRGQKVPYVPPASTHMPQSQMPPYTPGGAPPLYHGYEAQPTTEEFGHNHGFQGYNAQLTIEQFGNHHGYHGHAMESYGSHGYGPEAYGYQQAGQYSHMVSHHQIRYGAPQLPQQSGEAVCHQAPVVPYSLTSVNMIASQVPTYPNARLGIGRVPSAALNAVSVLDGVVSAAERIGLPQAINKV